MSETLEALREDLARLPVEEHSTAILAFIELARQTGALESMAGGVAEFINLLPPLMRRALVDVHIKELRTPLPTFDHPTTSAWVDAFDNHQQGEHA